jgi:hypothetical protein
VLHAWAPLTTMIFAQGVNMVPTTETELQAAKNQAFNEACERQVAQDLATKEVLDTKADSASPKKAGCFSCFTGTSLPG